MKKKRRRRRGEEENKREEKTEEKKRKREAYAIRYARATKQRRESFHFRLAESFTWTRRKVFSDSRGLRTSLFLLLELRPEVNRALATLKCRQKYLHMPPPLHAPRLASFSQRYWTFYRVEREGWKVKAEAGNKAAAGNSRSAYRYPWKSSIEAKVSPITKGICLRRGGATLVSKVTNIGL